MEIIKDFRNDLLKRKEVEVTIESDSNPGFDFSREKVSSEFGVAADVVAIKAVRGKFGSNEFLVEAFIYDSVDDMEKTEVKPKVKVVAK